MQDEQIDQTQGRSHEREKKRSTANVLSFTLVAHACGVKSRHFCECGNGCANDTHRQRRAGSFTESHIKIEYGSFADEIKQRAVPRFGREMCGKNVVRDWGTEAHSKSCSRSSYEAICDNADTPCASSQPQASHSV